MGLKYRFKSGDFISGWLLADGLREAAKAKTLSQESQIQQAGREDWVSARSIPGLFPSPVIAAPVEPVERESESARADQRQSQRPPESIHHLLHRALHMPIQLVAHDCADQSEHFMTGTLAGLTVEGMMVEFTERSAIVYIPLSRVHSALVSNKFPALGPPRRGETVRVVLESLPDLSSFALQSLSGSARATV